MSRHVIVLGAGIVGVSVAYHLAAKGCDVTLIDRLAPGRETSFGNAGIIQREAVEPHAFPRGLGNLLRIASHRSIGVRYRPAGLVASARPLFRYWKNSSPTRYTRIVSEYATLIALSTRCHAPMIELAGAQSLISRAGWIELYRTEAEFQRRQARAQNVHNHLGVNYGVLSRSGLARLEPNLTEKAVGAIHWRNSWTVGNPGALVSAYADLYTSIGGRFLQDEAVDLAQRDGGWSVTTTGEAVHASDVVIALGPWSQDWCRYLGYRMPLFALRGYHMHYEHAEEPLHHWFMDAETGYIVGPMKGGVRLTTGAESSAGKHRPMTPSWLRRSKRQGSCSPRWDGAWMGSHGLAQGHAPPT